MLSSCGFLHSSENDESQKYPNRYLYKRKVRPLTPEGLKINWEKLELFEKKGKKCITKYGKDDSLCNERGYEEEKKGNVGEAIEYYRRSCIEIDYRENFRNLGSSGCGDYVRLSLDSFGIKASKHLSELSWHKCKLLGVKRCSLSLTKGEPRAALAEKVCFELRADKFCGYAASAWVEHSKKRMKKNLNEYCTRVSSKLCGIMKEVLIKKAKDKDRDLSLKELE